MLEANLEAGGLSLEIIWPKKPPTNPKEKNKTKKIPTLWQRDMSISEQNTEISSANAPRMSFQVEKSFLVEILIFSMLLSLTVSYKDATLSSEERQHIQNSEQ